MIHEVRIYSKEFQAIVDGRKTFIIHSSKRRIEEGDEILLREYHPVKGLLGQSILMKVSYIELGGREGIDPDFCILALKKIDQRAALYLLHPDSEAARLVRESNVLKEASEQLLERAELVRLGMMGGKNVRGGGEGKNSDGD